MALPAATPRPRPLPTPEQKARQQIDQQLVQAGWLVQDYAQMHVTAGPGVAVREFPLITGPAIGHAAGPAIGHADHLLYVGRQGRREVFTFHRPENLPGWSPPSPRARCGPDCSGCRPS